MTTKVDPRAVRVETSTSQSGPLVTGVVKVSSTIDRFFLWGAVYNSTLSCVFTVTGHNRASKNETFACWVWES